MSGPKENNNACDRSSNWGGGGGGGEGGGGGGGPPRARFTRRLRESGERREAKSFLRGFVYFDKAGTGASDVARDSEEST